MLQVTATSILGGLLALAVTTERLSRLPRPAVCVLATLALAMLFSGPAP